MKAAYYHEAEHIEVGECQIKTPGPHEVRLEIAYCGICGTDVHISHGAYDWRIKNRPQVIGHECSATVAEVGEGVTEWKPGDRVVVRPLDYDGTCKACRSGFSHVCEHLKFMGVESSGAFQYSWTVHERTLHHIPDELSLKHAALVEPLAVCCHAVARAMPRPGEFAVIIGCGPIGLMTAIAARDAGLRVLVSEVNEVRLEKARELGFEAINPKETDIVEYVKGKTKGSGADIVFEVSATQIGLSTAELLPRVHGKIVIVAYYSAPMTIHLEKLFLREISLTTTRVYEEDDYDRALDMMARKCFDPEALITAVYPLSKIGEAIKACDPESKNMNVVKVLVDCHED